MKIGTACPNDTENEFPRRKQLSFREFASLVKENDFIVSDDDSGRHPRKVCHKSRPKKSIPLPCGREFCQHQLCYLRTKFRRQLGFVAPF